MELLEVKTTTGSREEAEMLADAAVDAHIAACAQIAGPIDSIYWWDGVIEHATEWVCIFKTRAANFSALEELIKQRHGYEVPEIIATPIVGGSDDYLAWLIAQTSI